VIRLLHDWQQYNRTDRHVKRVAIQPQLLRVILSSDYRCSKGHPLHVPLFPHAAKVQALHANPTVALTSDTTTFPPHELLVRGTARVEMVDGVLSVFSP
jgi:hypothetical protein